MNASASAGSILKPLNPGTTKLIRHRCEGDVRSRIVRWSGLPIGGTGAVAFLVTLIVWIPQQVRDADLTEFGRDLLRTRVQDAVTDNADFRQHLESVVKSTSTERVKQEIAGQIEKHSKDNFSKTLASRIEDTVSEEVERILQDPKMEVQIITAVTAALKSDKYDLLRTEIRPRLSSMAQRVSEKIATNATQTIRKFESPLPENQIIDKSTLADLQQKVNELGSRALPSGDFVLRFYVAAGSGDDHYYHVGVIKEYLSVLGQVLGPRLSAALVLDKRQGFIALSEVERFEEVVKNRGAKLQEVLNTESFSLEKAKQEIKELLGARSLAYLDENSTIKEALKNEILQTHSGSERTTDQQVAVVRIADGRRIFQGLTSRRRLLEALLP